MREAREEVCEEAEVVCSVRIVVWKAIQELRNGLDQIRWSGLSCTAMTY